MLGGPLTLMARLTWPSPGAGRRGRPGCGWPADARPDGVEHVLLLAIHGQRDDAHGKTRAVPTLVGGLGRHRLALPDPLQDGQDGRPGIFWHQVGGRHPHQLGGRIAVDPLRPPVGLQDGQRGHGQVGDKDADGHVLEVVTGRLKKPMFMAAARATSGHRGRMASCTTAGARAMRSMAARRGFGIRARSVHVNR